MREPSRSEQHTMDQEGHYRAIYTTCGRIAVFTPDGDYFCQFPGRFTREEFYGDEIKAKIVLYVPNGHSYCTVENVTWPVLGTNERARRVKESLKNEVPNS